MAKKTAAADVDSGTLIERLAEAKQALFNLRFQNATGQLENTTRLNYVKKDIARCETLLREREIAAADALKEHA